MIVFEAAHHPLCGVVLGVLPSTIETLAKVLTEERALLLGDSHPDGMKDQDPPVRHCGVQGLHIVEVAPVILLGDGPRQYDPGNHHRLVKISDIQKENVLPHLINIQDPIPLQGAV